ncbi:type II toxin-antitoxin system HicA family toxin [Halorubrum sp. BV1]|uniref:type II toxin-antitoxin system HicA family toxin n=1 Tax=Halorubrum sp. BV1 TaxID=1498500 RepID=UPI0006788087|nr:type II toxin-antitoxin system HicA family toxin [Halorubrum sp. BV1]
MVRQRFTGREIVSVLTSMNYTPVDRTGSHLKLRYVHPKTGETRNVTVPIGHEISGDTLRNIADQCGADDFHAWCEWIDEHR